MTTLDDMPLDKGSGDDVQQTPSAPSSPGPRVQWVLASVAVAVLLGAGGWYFVSRQSAPAPATSPPPEAAQDAAAPVAAAVPAVAAPELPPMSEMDPFVRSLLTSIGSHPALLSWLATDDLIGAIATAIDRLAQGQSPARDLSVLRPAGRFTVARRGGVHADPASFARYAGLVEAATAIDATALAGAFATLRPRLAEAYVRQGHPQGGFDDAVRRAVEIVATTPDVPATSALVPAVGGYAYADPALELLPPAQKQLLRMGPEHVRRVRDAARKFGTALQATSTR